MATNPSPQLRWARANRKVNSKPETLLRSVLHRRGFRFRKNYQVVVPGLVVRPDIVFVRLHVAVFVDGCFWHVCPMHGGQPRSNADYWALKLHRNMQRDRFVESRLIEAGWAVVRIWEHTQASEAVEIVAKAVAVARGETRDAAVEPERLSPINQ